MICKECKIYYTKDFSHFSNYCKQTDRFITMNNFNCPVKIPLNRLDRFKIKINCFFRHNCKLVFVK